jgi:ribosomal protein S18 acetylase RimI-like enzyme
VNDDVRRAFAFMRRADMAGTRTAPFRFGTAVFDEGLPTRWDSNYLLVEGAPADAGELAAEADAVQGAGGVTHRTVLVPDEVVGARLAESFREFGWQVHVHVVMVHRRPPTPGAPTGEVEEVDEAVLRPARRHAILGYPWGSEATADVLLAAKTAIAERVRTRFFARLVDGEPVAWADLYTADDVAQIEDVATDDAHRGHGHATAVVLRALAAALEEGAGFVFLVADDEDWPKLWYERLGFESAGRYFKFVRPG